MEEAKIIFSPEEMGLITDSRWILTKNAVITKLYEGMGRLSRRMEAAVAVHAAVLPVPFAFSGAKISRGENYQGLPYLMLDYPRVFGREGILAIRTFFWWGRYCSITLHASGPYLAPVWKEVMAQAAMLGKEHFVCATGGDEWNHNLEGGQYVPMEKSFWEAERASSMAFVKVASPVALEQWPLMEEALYGRFLLLLPLCVGKKEG